jgi:hypothetical protein
MVCPDDIKENYKGKLLIFRMIYATDSVRQGKPPDQMQHGFAGPGAAS